MRGHVVVKTSKPNVTLKLNENRKTFDILWEENGVEKNVGTGQYLDSALWFYLLEDNLDIWVNDGDNLNLIIGWD